MSVLTKFQRQFGYALYRRFIQEKKFSVEECANFLDARHSHRNLAASSMYKYVEGELPFPFHDYLPDLLDFTKDTELPTSPWVIT